MKTLATLVALCMLTIGPAVYAGSDCHCSKACQEACARGENPDCPCKECKEHKNCDCDSDSCPRKKDAE